MSIRYPAGPAPVSLFKGSMPAFAADRLGFLESNLAYGPIAHFRFGPRHAYQVNDPALIHDLLVGHGASLERSRILKITTRAALGSGLLTSEGELHRRQRRLIQPAFHHRRIMGYADVTVGYTREALAAWPTGETIDFSTEMMKLTMRIVGRTLFDVDFSGSAEALGQAITVGVEAAGARISKPLQPPIWFPTAANRERRRMGRLLEDTITSMIVERRSDGTDRGDLLSMLLHSVDEDGIGMPDRQVRDECMTLFIAGHETTANALAWAFYLVSQYPGVEQKLVAEIDAALGDRPARFEDLSALPYVEMVIKEALRLYPPAWLFGRTTVADITLGKVIIRRGSPVLVSPWAIHRHPGYWADPTAFDPERFSPAREPEITRYAYIPFGGGPRVCIGNSFAMMEAQLILATVFQSRCITYAGVRAPQPEPLVTLRPSGGVPVILADRGL